MYHYDWEGGQSFISWIIVDLLNFALLRCSQVFNLWSCERTWSLRCCGAFWWRHGNDWTTGLGKVLGPLASRLAWSPGENQEDCFCFLVDLVTISGASNPCFGRNMAKFLIFLIVQWPFPLRKFCYILRNAISKWCPGYLMTSWSKLTLDAYPIIIHILVYITRITTITWIFAYLKFQKKIFEQYSQFTFDGCTRRSLKVDLAPSIWILLSWQAASTGSAAWVGMSKFDHLEIN